MQVNSVNQPTASKKGQIIGTAVGLTTGGAILVKNGKNILNDVNNAVNSALQGKRPMDCFIDKNGVNVTELALKNKIKTKKMAIAVGASALLVGVLTLAGNLIGKGIGRIVDDKNQMKQQETEIKEAIASNEEIAKTLGKEVNNTSTTEQ